MAEFQIEFDEGGVFLPSLNLWLDPRDPKTGSERVFVSHAHSDHTAAHREIILSRPTSRLMQARLPGMRQEHVLDFGQPQRFESAGAAFNLTLLPAGHIFGSAMSLIETGGQKLLYTGDFKLRPGLSAEKCEPVPADILIMETTYGRPQYRFPATKEVLKGVVRFCREALDNDETAILLGYSLGKSQEILCSLGDAGLPLALHSTIYKLTKIYEQFGHCFPPYERFSPGNARGKVLLCPPNTVTSGLLRALGKTRSAVLTGWAVDPNCRYRSQCDAAFPLSDHADFDDLVELVKRVRPKKVYTLHGFAADFAQTLRGLGCDAAALSEHEQLSLALDDSQARRRHPQRAGKLETPGLANAASPPVSPPSPDSFLKFAGTCSAVRASRGKLEKIQIVSAYLRGLREEDLPQAATWLTGAAFPPAQNRKLQIGWAVLRDSLAAAGGLDDAGLHHVYLKHSDAGETAFEILEREQRPAKLSLHGVAVLFDQLAAARAPAVRKNLLASALESATAPEAKFLVKIITGDLRIGLKEGLLEDAVAAAFGVPSGEIREANLLLGDIGATARLAALHRLGDASLQPFRPVKLMLASPEPTAAAIWRRACEWHEKPGTPAVPVSPMQNPAPSPAVWIEDKYDGIRCQIHKAGDKVSLYSRDLKDITATFPELADAARLVRADFILDGEIVAARGDEILPFAELQKRLGRKEVDLFLREQTPVRYIAFDLLWNDGRTYLKEPMESRRAALEALAPFPDAIALARITRTASEEEIETAFDAARARGNEGLMIKDPRSAYSPGRRGLAWLKLKKALATLDCVVVRAEYGHGKRAKVLSDYTFAVLDESDGTLKTIGKAYSGLTDAEIETLTTHFLKTAIRQRGRCFDVKPDVVLEIAFDKIQPSDRHSSGLALRFPRIHRIRADKPLAEIDTLATARKLAGVPIT